MISRFAFILGTVLYVLLTGFASVHGTPHGLEFTGDAETYNRTAIHLLDEHFYSLDGLHPFVQREPLYSFFLAGIYAVFGSENLTAIFLVQLTLYFAACIAFVCVLDRFVQRRVTDICFVFLLTSPSVMHTLFLVYREALILPILLLLAASILSYLHQQKWFKAALIGLFLGLLPLGYYSFIYLPIFFLGYLLYRRANRLQVILMGLITVLILGFWGVRNFKQDGTFQIVGSARTDIVWYVRGEQAEKIRGFEPFRCLWSEYISRDWSHRSGACSYNGLLHARWPNGPTALDAQIGAAGQAKIRQHFGWYLWFSLFEILELHLPFVGGGWSFVFNLAAAIGSAVIYVGCSFGLSKIFDRRFATFLILIGYNTLVFILTDATPRYLIPVTFCYAVIAAVGYDALLQAIHRRFGTQKKPS